MSAKNTSPLTAVWDFFCSLKLTITILILLAVTSIIGTVIQQNLSPQEYLQIYGETKYRIFQQLQFLDMYHSWWFLGLLGLFTINLIACSIKRLPRVWKTINEPVLVASDSLYKSLSNFEEHLVKGVSVKDVAARMTEVLTEGFNKPVVTEDGDKIHLYAEKAAYARFGVYVTHLSIIIIFIGAIIGSIWGYKAFVNIVEGTSTNQIWPRGSNEHITLDFSVRCDEFSVTFYEGGGGGRPKEFRSVLTVEEGGQTVVDRRPIIVNDPLSYKGITFYQASYGQAGDPVFDFAVKARDTGDTQNYTVRQGQRVALPGGAFFMVSGFTPSYQSFGPAARLDYFPAGGQKQSFIILQTHPEFDLQRRGEFSFALLGAKQKYYTGLQVAKDPGVWVVWTGCFLMVIGCMVAFFLSHRRIWMTVMPVDGKTGVKLGGSAHRNQPGFELFFDELKKKVNEKLKS